MALAVRVERDGQHLHRPFVILLEALEKALERVAPVVHLFRDFRLRLRKRLEHARRLLGERRLVQSLRRHRLDRLPREIPRDEPSVRRTGEKFAEIIPPRIDIRALLLERIGIGTPGRIVVGTPHRRLAQPSREHQEFRLVVSRPVGERAFHGLNVLEALPPQLEHALCVRTYPVDDPPVVAILVQEPAAVPGLSGALRHDPVRVRAQRRPHRLLRADAADARAQILARPA